MLLFYQIVNVVMMNSVSYSSTNNRVITNSIAIIINADTTGDVKTWLA